MRLIKLSALSLMLAGVLSSTPYAGTIDTEAGSSAIPGYLDTDALNAKLASPKDVAVDVSGNVYIADTQNGVIRKLDVNAVPPTVSTLTTTPAIIPNGLAYHVGNNTLFISSAFAHQVFEVNLTTGVATLVAGSGAAGFAGDAGDASMAQLNRPAGLAFDSVGNLYIADELNNRVRTVDLGVNPAVISTVAGDGSTTVLDHPQDIALDGSDLLYVADSLNNRIQQYDLLNTTVTTFAGTGSAGSSGDISTAIGGSGDATLATLNNPVGIDFDLNGNLYVSEFTGNVIRKINRGGLITTFAGDGTLGFLGDGGDATLAQFYLPAGLSVDGSALHIADTVNNRIRKVIMDIAPPNAGSVVITNNNPTDSIVFPLTLNCSDGVGTGCQLMRFSEDGGVNWSDWEAYSTSRTWTLLNTNDGSKTLTVNYLDGDFNFSSVTSAAIVLDRMAPFAPTIDTGTFTAIPNSGGFITNVAPSVISGIKEADSSLALRDGVNALGADLIIDSATSWNFTLNAPLAENVSPGYSLSATSADAAGNISLPSATALLYVDLTSPVISVLGVDPLDVEAGSVYNDPGASASDNSDGLGITATIGSDANLVDTAKPATFTVNYTATDLAGNVAIATRTVNVIDTTPPAITITPHPGQTSVDVILWKDTTGTFSYNDAGAIAQDLVDGDVTAKISVTNPVDITVAGVYQVVYSVTDAANNTATATRVVVVKDLSGTVVPVISLLGSSPVTVQVNDLYTDAGAVAVDPISGIINLTAVGTVDTAALGKYELTYDYTDAAGNIATQVIRVVNVVDSIKPVINWDQNSPITVEAGTSYTDAGATASDNFDPQPPTVLTNNTVNVNLPGIYTITYSAADSSGNQADPVIRTVVVRDSILPQITLNGAANITLQVGDTYNELGAAASDSLDGDLSSVVQITGTVDTTKPGLYTLIYRVSDAAGNAAQQVVRQVSVVDLEQPLLVITNNLTQLQHEAGTPFVVPVATATDAVDGDLSASIAINNSVNPDLPGSYVLIYSVVDSSRNLAQVTIPVTVIDSIPPEIILEGNASVTLEVGSSYSDAGATASDSIDGNLTSQIKVTSSVDASVLGSYSVQYSVTDRSGNTAQLSRSVEVVDTTAPVVTLQSNTLSLMVGEVFTPPEMSAQDNYDGVISKIDAVGNVDRYQTGEYSVSYTATDSSGNVSEPVVLTVTVMQAATISSNSGGGALNFWMLLLGAGLMGVRGRPR